MALFTWRGNRRGICKTCNARKTCGDAHASDQLTFHRSVALPNFRFVLLPSCPLLLLCFYFIIITLLYYQFIITKREAFTLLLFMRRPVGPDPGRSLIVKGSWPRSWSLLREILITSCSGGVIVVASLPCHSIAQHVIAYRSILCHRSCHLSYRTVPQHTISYDTISHRVMPQNAISRYSVLYNIVLCHIIILCII